LGSRARRRRPVRRQLHPPSRVDLVGAWQAEPVHAGVGVVGHVRREDHAEDVVR
jgi:hypothetical protein